MYPYRHRNLSSALGAWGAPAAIIGALILALPAPTRAATCSGFERIAARAIVEHPTREQIADFHRTVVAGLGVSKRKLGTTIYHVAHEHPLPGYPEVAEDARAIIIGFGGSGTFTSSGRNFMQDAGVFSNYKVSVIGFDYPFHASGPQGSQYMDAAQFKKMVFAIVKHYKASGKPVYLMGHSMGPAVIQEILFDAPDLVRGAIMLSPGGPTNQAMQAHYNAMLKSGVLDTIEGRTIKVSPTAEIWETKMDDQFRSNKAGRQKTTRPVLFMAGDQDLWSTPALIASSASEYPNATVEILQGVGHNIFAARGKIEKRVTERVLQLISETEGIPLRSDPVGMSNPTRVRYFQNNSILFRSWLQARFPGREPDFSELRIADAVIEEWSVWFRDKLLSIAGQSALLNPQERDVVAKIVAKKPETRDGADTEKLIGILIKGVSE